MSEDTSAPYMCFLALCSKLKRCTYTMYTMKNFEVEVEDSEFCENVLLFYYPICP